MTTTPDIIAAARLVAKLLAHRATPQDEIDGVIRGVHGALSQFGRDEGAAVTPPPPPREAPAAERRRRPARPAPAPQEPEQSAEPSAPPAPKLVRRADIASPPPAAPLVAAPPHGVLRGVVKWYDPRSGRGALRLPGFSGDIAIEARLLVESGIARLFKGQEIEASIAGEGGAPPQLQRLTLPGSTSASPLGSSGVVHSRRAKPVLVELKREALKRVAARAEAEHLLGSTRSR